MIALLMACAEPPEELACVPGQIAIVAGVPGFAGRGPDGLPAVETWLSQPQDVTVGPNGTWWVDDYNNHVIREVDAAGIARVLVGSGFPSGGDGGPALDEPLDHPTMALPDPADAHLLWFAATGNHRIGRVDRAAAWVEFPYGEGLPGFAGDGGPASDAWFWRPSSVAFGDDGTMYVSDRMNQVVRAIDPSGIVRTVAGTPGVPGYTGDGGLATEATLNAPEPTETDPGNRLDVQGDRLVLADTGNDAVRVVDLATGQIVTLLGPDVGLSAPHDVAIGAEGQIAVADTDNQQVHVFAADGEPLATAGFGAPVGVAWDTAGSVWVADRNDHLVYRWCGAED